MSASKASSVLASATILCSWPVEKYARYVPSFPPLPTGECDHRKSNNTGSWQTSTFRSGEADIVLLQGNHLMLKAGSTVLESFSLWEAKQKLKGVAKGDSMLFMCKLKGESRRFRVKFAATPSQSSPDICKAAVEILESIFPIKNASDISLDSQRFGTQMDISSQSSISACGSNLGITVANLQKSSTSDAPLSTVYEAEMLPQHPVSTEVGTISNIAPQPQSQVPVVGTLSTTLPIQPTVPSRGVDHSYASCRCDLAAAMDESEPNPLPHLSGGESFRQGSNDEIQQSEYFSDAKTCSDLVREMLESKVSLGRAYADCHIPPDQLAQFIRLCFLDQNFPSFVEAVQTKLNKM